MLLVHISLRNPVTGDMRTIERRLDPAAFAQANWAKTFPLVQTAVNELVAAEATKDVELPVL